MSHFSVFLCERYCDVNKRMRKTKGYEWFSMNCTPKVSSHVKEVGRVQIMCHSEF